MADGVRVSLSDLEVVARWALALVVEDADRDELVEILEADLRWLRGQGPTEPAGAVERRSGDERRTEDELTDELLESGDRRVGERRGTGTGRVPARPEPPQPPTEQTLRPGSRSGDAEGPARRRRRPPRGPAARTDAAAERRPRVSAGTSSSDVPTGGDGVQGFEAAPHVTEPEPFDPDSSSTEPRVTGSSAASSGAVDAGQDAPTQEGTPPGSDRPRQTPQRRRRSPRGPAARSTDPARRTPAHDPEEEHPTSFRTGPASGQAADTQVTDPPPSSAAAPEGAGAGPDAVREGSTSAAARLRRRRPPRGPAARSTPAPLPHTESDVRPPVESALDFLDVAPVDPWLEPDRLEAILAGRSATEPPSTPPRSGSAGQRAAPRRRRRPTSNAPRVARSRSEDDMIAPAEAPRGTPAPNRASYALAYVHADDYYDDDDDYAAAADADDAYYDDYDDAAAAAADDAYYYYDDYAAAADADQDGPPNAAPQVPSSGDDSVWQGATRIAPPRRVGAVRPAQQPPRGR